MKKYVWDGVLRAPANHPHPLLSHFRDPQHLDRLLEQDWVPEWTGWRELQAKLSDAQCLVLAERFMAVAQANQPQGSKSNEARTTGRGRATWGVLQIPADVGTRQRICVLAYSISPMSDGSEAWNWRSGSTTALIIMGSWWKQVTPAGRNAWRTFFPSYRWGRNRLRISFWSALALQHWQCKCHIHPGCEYCA